VPITRLVDVTPLDRSNLPVWSAVTPIARDLTVHAGKGTSSLAARLSAIMEAIERVSAETLPEVRLRHASYRSLSNGDNVLDPRDLGLPFDTTFTPDREIRWTLGVDLVTGCNIWVPVDAVISPAEEGVCRGVETNGLAAGNTITEATLHALCELVERDAVSINRFCEVNLDMASQRAARILDPNTLPDIARSYVERLVAVDLRVVIEDLTSDLGIPVFGALATDFAFAGNQGNATSFIGHGCDLDPTRAVMRALTEAAQAHAIVVLGARDTIEGTRSLPNRVPRLRRQLDVIRPRSFVRFQDSSFASGDLWQDTQLIVRRLESAGIRRCIVVGLTRTDLGVPVVRVIVPGLEPPYGFSTRRPGPRLLKVLV
jgi:ribosomal protein S12 methylthiotransferase accessory factor